MIAIGIDPGLSGALVAIDGEGRIVGALLMPTLAGLTKGRVVDVLAVRAWLEQELPQTDQRACLEGMQVRPGEGASTARTAGCNWGRLDACLSLLGIRYEVVAPQKWQTALMGRGDREAGKGRAILFAERLFPSLELTPGKRKKPHDGLADAACLAEYARRTL